MVRIEEYETEAGQSPFEKWFNKLNARAAAKVTMALTKMTQGNMSNVEGVGAGVYENKIDFGPGYRVYFGKAGIEWIILLGGGTKKK